MTRSRSVVQTSQQQQERAVFTADEAREHLREELRNQLAIMAATSSGIDATKMAGLALTHFTRTPALWNCSPVSIARAVVEASQLGLDMHFGSVYLVPYRNNRTGQTEAQLIVGYRGLATLARRSGEVRRVWADVVHQRDEFRYQRGLNPDLVHVPYQPATTDDLDPGPMTHAYAVAEFSDGGRQFDVMTAAEVYAIRARSKGAFVDGRLTGPWLTDEGEMAKKTVLRRLSKMLPLTTEARIVLDAEDRAEGDRSTPAAPTPMATLAAGLRGTLLGSGAAGQPESVVGDGSAPDAQPAADPDQAAAEPADDTTPVPVAAPRPCGVVHQGIGAGPCTLPAGHDGVHQDARHTQWEGGQGGRRQEGTR